MRKLSKASSQHGTGKLSHLGLLKSSVIHCTISSRTTHHHVLKELIVEEHSDGLVCTLPHSRYLCRWSRWRLVCLRLQYLIVLWWEQSTAQTAKGSQQAARLSVWASHLRQHTHTALTRHSYVICKATCTW